MNYVPHFNFFGVEAKQIPCIVDSGNPNDLADYTQAGCAAIGLLYMDSDNGDLYKCTAENDGVFAWEKFGDSPVLSGSGAPTGDTAGVKGNLYVDTSCGDLYVCTAVYGSYHMWDKVVPKTSESVSCAATEYPTITVGEDFATLAAADSEAAATIHDCYGRNMSQIILSLKTNRGSIEVSLKRTTLNGSTYYAGFALGRTSDWHYLLVHLSTNGGAITCKVVELATVST